MSIVGLTPGTLYIQRETNPEGFAIKLVPELLGNDALYSQIFTFLFEAVPIYGLVLNLIAQTNPASLMPKRDVCRSDIFMYI